MSNPNLYKYEPTLDFTKLGYKTIFDSTPIKPDATISLVEAKNSVPDNSTIDNLKSQHRERPLQNPNADLNTTREQAQYERAGEKSNNILESNLALKQGNIALFRELNGRDPTTAELVAKRIGARDAASVPTTTERAEVTTIQFDEPYGADKVEFDEYLQELIRNGTNYKLLPQPDGSIIIQHTKLLRDKINKVSNATTIDGFLDKFDVINPTTGKLNLYKLDRIKREDIMLGLKLLGVDYSDITQRYDLLRLLKSTLLSEYGKSELNIDKTTGSLTKMISDEVVTNMTSKRKRSATKLAIFLNQNIDRLTGDQIKRIEQRIDELSEAEARRGGLHRPNFVVEQTPDPDEMKYAEIVENPTELELQLKGEGIHSSKVKNRLAIGLGQIRAGNDSRKNKNQVFRDITLLGKKGIEVKSLVKRLL